MSKPDGILIEFERWFRCPSCGMGESDNDRTAITGTQSGVTFTDGRLDSGKPFHQQSSHWSLGCPCGHRWVVETIWTNVGGTRHYSHTKEAWDAYQAERAEWARQAREQSKERMEAYRAQRAAREAKGRG